MTISKSISWNYDKCVMRTYRVAGRCKSGTGCFPPCNPPRDSPQFSVNITACSVDEVCAKLKRQTYVRNLNSVYVFNAPLKASDSPIDPTKDPFHLFDVTPTVADCNECCELLIGEDLTQTVVVADSVELG